MSEDQFRQVMGHFATGVVVAATRDASGIPTGLTCNSVTSVSLDPPLVLFCLDRSSTTRPSFLHTRAFSLSILGEEDETTSRQFASTDAEARFQGIPVREGITGVPILTDALAWLDCVLHEVVEAGDHTIFLGRVQAMGVREDAGKSLPLLYYRGKYRGLSP
jgi:flavin reductase (DIM6/NTAB) family NADH-FMN oxidoreductase RutF